VRFLGKLVGGWVGGSVVGAVLTLGLPATGLAATTYNVDTQSDTNAVNPAVSCQDSSGHCSLRSSIEAANVNGGAAVINVPPGTYTLTGPGGGGQGTSGELLLTASPITIAGAGASSTIVDANFLDRAFEGQGGPDVTITGLTIKNGRPGGIGNVTSCPSSPEPEADGGAILTNGTLTLTNDKLTNNIVSGGGGGLFDNSSDQLTISNTTISNNQACLPSSFLGSRDGGGILLTGDVTAQIDSSLISGNSAFGSGGGLDEQGGTAAITITNSTFSSNSAFDGGGLAMDGGGTEATLFADTLTNNDATNGGGGYENGGADDQIINTTIAGNMSSAQGNGGAGIWTSNGSDVVSFSTITDNTAGSGAGNIFVEVGETSANLHIDDSIVARGHGSEADCSGVTSSGHNLFDDTSDSGAQCDAGSSDLVKSAIKLGTLAKNGGPTKTEALQFQSPALDGASDQLCTNEAKSPPPPNGGPIDQRAIGRPQGPHCDIGAFEATPDLGLSGSAKNDQITVGDQDTVTWVVNNSNPGSALNSTFTDPAAGYKIDSATPSKGSCTHTAKSAKCHLGTDPAHASVTIKVVLTGLRAGKIMLHGVTDTSDTDLRPGNNDASVAIRVVAKPPPPPKRRADLSITDSVSPGRVEVNQGFTYSLVVKNHGPDADTNVRLADGLPKGVSFKSVKVDSGRCSGAKAGVRCSLGRMRSGSTRHIQIAVTGVKVGRQTDAAAVRGALHEPRLGNNRAHATAVVVGPPGISIGPLGPACYRESSTIQITVTATAPAGIRTLTIQVGGHTVKTYSPGKHPPSHKTLHVAIRGNSLLVGRTYTVAASVVDTLGGRANTNSHFTMCKSSPKRGFTG
jgi:uncharacterized repeat protein (TIGR01451 family)